MMRMLLMKSMFFSATAFDTSSFMKFLKYTCRLVLYNGFMSNDGSCASNFRMVTVCGSV